MALREFSLTTEEWATAITSKKNNVHLLRVEGLYNIAVDAINAGEYKFAITNEQLDILQEVDVLLREKGFRLIRGLGGQAYIDLKTPWAPEPLV